MDARTSCKAKFKSSCDDPSLANRPYRFGQVRPLNHSLLVQRPDASVSQPGVGALEKDLANGPAQLIGLAEVAQ